MKRGMVVLLCMVFLMVCARLAFAYEDEPAVRCFLVVPPGTPPFEDAKERLTLALKDVQWWYSCQMEAHGYGSKTFPLELDRQGQVQIHLIRLKDKPPEGEDRRVQFKVQQACLDVARKAGGNSPNGTIMLVVYGDYIWMNRNEFAVWPCGTGKAGQWTFLTAYHYHCICSAAWHIETPLSEYAAQDGPFSKEHVRVMKSHYTYRRSVADRTRWLSRPVGLHAVMGHGILAHELGHAFGLQHRKQGEPLVNRSVMQNGYVHMRGNFLSDRNEACCLTALDAAKLDKNPLFAERDVAPPSTAASREVGMRGAKEAIAAARATMEPQGRRHEK